MRVLEEARTEMAAVLELFGKAGYEVSGFGDADRFLSFLDEVILREGLNVEEYFILEAAYDRLTRVWRKLKRGAKSAGLVAHDLWQKAAVEAGLKEHPLWKRSARLGKKINKVRSNWQVAMDKGDKKAMDRHQATLFALQSKQDRILKALHKRHKHQYPKVLKLGGEA